MKCIILQRRLLALEYPNRPPAELQEHLAGCETCQEWQRELMQLEQRIPLLPVPPSTRKNDFLRLLQSSPPPAAARLRRVAERNPGADGPWGQGRERGIRKVALATALAAGLMMFAAGWWFWQHHGGTPVSPKGPAGDPLLASLFSHDLSLAKAPARPERIRELAGVAHDLFGQTEALTQAGEDDSLRTLALWYGQVIRDGILHQAATLPADDRHALDDVVAQLTTMGSKARELAEQAPKDCKGPLGSIALSADDAAQQLMAGAPPRVTAPRAWRWTPALAPRGGPMLLALPVMMPASVTPAVPAAQRGPVAEQVSHFLLNIKLIRTLVAQGLRLAGEEDALKRADCCSVLAHDLADAVRQAANQREQGRVAELGGHLKTLLQDGVAANLSKARRTIPHGSAEEADLRRVQEKTMKFLGPLEERLQESGAAGEALKDIQDGYKNVQDALTGGIS